jgi:transposase
VEFFRAEKIAVVEDNSSKTCRSCGEKLKLIRTMVNSQTGSVIHMFECRCGERTWDD